MNLRELFPTASEADLKLYFQHTLIYAKLRGEREYRLRYVHEIGQGQPCVMLLCDTPEVAHTAWDVNDVDVEIRYPESGYANWRSTVILLRRYSKRQNQKGICANTVEVDNIFGRMLKDCIGGKPTFKLLDKYVASTQAQIATMGAVSWSNIMLYQVLTNEQQTTPIGEAWNRVSLSSHHVIARAISRRFALSKGITSNVPSLWFDGTEVAQMPDPRHIQMNRDDTSIFHQEVVDCFVPQGIEVVV